MWSAFMKEADNLLFSDGASHVKEAIENISSLGIWYNGPEISLPLRRYTVRVPNAAGEEENVVLLGLISFTYSSYIMQLRSMAQQTTLATLAYLREQLRTNCLFVPPLLLASRQLQ
ncbi:hypothetical protein STCU_00094 [Strigomonas culicis]|nr:hypothetical protein STCU_00094 [Strigomonas culicis]|eukprot:EPY37203.1 hypothetical protein STCU_00094 [Strigomonas culicis]